MSYPGLHKNQTRQIPRTYSTYSSNGHHKTKQYRSLQEHDAIVNAALERAGWGQQEQVTSVSPSVSPAISGTSHLIGEKLLGTSKRSHLIGENRFGYIKEWKGNAPPYLKKLLTLE